MKKIIIVTDSTGNPRFFNLNEKIELQDTFPYLLKKKFKDDIIWQLSLGNYPTDVLLNQIIAYFSEWSPDIVIVSSGVNDSRPEPLSDNNKYLLLNSFILSFFFKRLIYSKVFIKFFAKKNKDITKFEKSIKKFINIFNSAKIYWVPIKVHSKYEKIRPGTIKNNIEFNKILKKHLKNNILRVDNLCDDDYFIRDGLHISKKGHQLIFEEIIKKLNGE